MIFASRAINTDPFPYRNKFDNSRWRDSGVDTQGSTVVYDPRFKYSDYTNANPILVDFREMSGIADLWLDVIEGHGGDAFLADTPKEFGPITADHITHARKVLSRLAALEQS